MKLSWTGVPVIELHRILSAFHLAGQNPAEIDLGWLDAIGLGLAGYCQVGMALDWLGVIEPDWY
jgi:hypothetical protein